jgi:hypothetical protein
MLLHALQLMLFSPKKLIIQSEQYETGFVQLLFMQPVRFTGLQLPLTNVYPPKQPVHEVLLLLLHILQYGAHAAHDLSDATKYE